MMGSKERHFAPLIHVSLDQLVPQDHFYRHLDRTLEHTARTGVGAANVCRRRASFD